MSKEGVQKIVGRMVSDTKFRDAIMKNPQKAISDAGYDVSAAELMAISKIKPSDLRVTVKPKGVGPVASFELDVRTARF